MNIVKLFKGKKKNFDSTTYVRKARLYCVGTAKSGTHSIDAIFDDTIRSQHEATDGAVIRKIIELSQDKISREDILDYLRKRDKKLCLDVDSSQLNFFLIDYLLEEFPDAKFLLTIRDCYSWLDSFINHSLARNASKEWLELRDYRFRSHLLKHPPEEISLKQRGLYTLEGYLSYWSSHNEKVLDTIPEDRLMIVKTKDISKRVFEIADFAGISKSSVRANKSHSFQNRKKINVLQEIEQSYLDGKVLEFCSELMKSYFPEVKSLR